MKLIDKIIYSFFWIHIIVVLVQLASLPLFIIKPELMECLIFGDKRELYHQILIPFVMIGTSFWIYCLWFYMKYDSRSNKLFALFFFNWIYAPIYYYEVKIKKRPLMGRNTDEANTEIKGNEMTDTEFAELNRENVYSVIDLWCSIDRQLDYQKNVPDVQVSIELYQQWEDFYFPDSDDFKQSFNKLELELLAEFNEALNNSIDRTPKNLPPIEDFIKSDEWKMMNSKARKIKDKLNTLDKSGES